MSSTYSVTSIPSNIYCQPGSKAEAYWLRRWGRETPSAEAPPAAGPTNEAIAGNLPPRPDLDLHDRHGKIIPNLTYKNFYVGGSAAWTASDRTNIDQALQAIMTDKGLNEILHQYLRGKSVETDPRPSEFLTLPVPTAFSEARVESLVRSAHQKGLLQGLPLESTVFNFLLPPGTVLTLNESPGQETDEEPRVADRPHVASIPFEDEDSSLAGLGGFHGSVHIANPGQPKVTVYYSVGVYSERLANGRHNGIVVFPDPWKNVVATFYHELCEARTDPDVGDAIRENDARFVGWSSNGGQEIGDTPMEVAGLSLTKVIREIKLTNGITAPVQVQWSNRVHGPELPPNA